ncbi:MAG: mRNA surveillance protein pelota [Methanobrevibacter boviskoreani]|uniref:mRNA surveillance protein pelota n=1 Tax=Methanobrevibacter boviskoreani TaxID=1348249 RepID=UPI000593CC0F|nr:mRNA surveillance protein pelota [Methanobrevibacter boviskoreani]MCI6775723.1 mRNA surveillance protein pelota [Methanobrevibacter boviskoreani]MCI6931185.1 mRNA surveillance protein pelota [Methanobrevibacter boviskoreani]MDY5615207.1 mRNA surveillance protein pelota [Methanobrevibacter boviskoreani]
MKIGYQNQKEGIIEVIPETLDDLWHLSHIVEEGDYVTSKTTRRIQDTTGDKLRSDRGVKKTFTLEVNVESISFHMFTGKLRLTGSITKGPEDLIPLGSHHTIEVKLNTPLKIRKEKWSKWTMDRLNQAIKASKKLSAIIILIEDDTATFGLIRQYGLEYYGPIIGNISGKQVLDKNRSKNLVKFYQSIVKSLFKFNDIQNIVIAGPGFWKNDFFKFLQDNYPEIADKSILESTGSGGRVGIQEVLRKGTVEKLSAENRIAFEMKDVNNLLTLLSTNHELVVYGKSQVENAVNMGAVKKLLVRDLNIRSDNLEKIMDLTENMGGEVTIISSEHEGGEQLQALGGVAAVLRYPIS